MVFTDSRGRDLNEFLDTSHILVQAFSGAGLMEIIDRSIPLVADFHPTAILYIGGTCDLTIKDKHTKKIMPRFLSFVDLCAHMMSLFKSARRRSIELFPDYKIAFGGLCGVDLNHYNNLPHYHIHQPIIDDTVNLLNYAIRADNINCQVYHPTLTSKIHLKRKGKQQRNQYRLLWDGVHLSESVLRDWATNIAKFHRNVHNVSVAKATYITDRDTSLGPETASNNSAVHDVFVAKATYTPLIDVTPAPDPGYTNDTESCDLTLYGKKSFT